jgi:hypothetical protein
LNALVVEELPIDNNPKLQIEILVGNSDSFKQESRQLYAIEKRFEKDAEYKVKYAYFMIA